MPEIRDKARRKIANLLIAYNVSVSEGKPKGREMIEAILTLPEIAVINRGEELPEWHDPNIEEDAIDTGYKLGVERGMRFLREQGWIKEEK